MAFKEKCNAVTSRDHRSGQKNVYHVPIRDLVESIRPSRYLTCLPLSEFSLSSEPWSAAT
jgi:hypothetical protein